MTNVQVWYAIAVIVLVTALTRFLPFILLSSSKKTPKIINKLGKMLPFAIMGMLVVYCLKDISFTSVSGFVPALIGCIIVATLYIWKRNTLLSIIVGTVSYMLLVQFVFQCFASLTAVSRQRLAVSEIRLLNQLTIITRSVYEINRQVAQQWSARTEGAYHSAKQMY